MHKAERLLQQQHNNDGWEFEPMPKGMYLQHKQKFTEAGYEHVYDPDDQGVWYRKHSVPRHTASRKEVAPQSEMSFGGFLSMLIGEDNHNMQPYESKPTRFSDQMDGFSDIFHGLGQICSGAGKIDKSTEGAFGESIWKDLRKKRFF